MTQVAHHWLDLEFQEASSLGETSTTGTTWVQKLRMTTASLVAGAKYRIGWCYNWRLDSISRDFLGRIQIDDTDEIMFHEQEPKDDIGDDQHPYCSGFAYYTPASDGSVNIDLDFAASNNNVTAWIKNARLEIWRVA